MRLLVFSNMFPSPMQPNAGIFVLEQMRALREIGVDATVVCPTPWVPPILKYLPQFQKYLAIPGRASVHGFSVEYKGTVQLPEGKLFYLYGFLYYLQCLGAIRKLVRESRIDLIHAHGIMPAGFAAALMGRKFDLPVVCTLHGSDVNCYPYQNRMNLWATRWALKTVDCLVAVSHDLKTKAHELVGKRQLEVIHNGADHRKFKPIPKDDSRARLGLAMDKKIILFVGNLVLVKGLDYLLRAISLLSRADVLLQVVGDGKEKSNLEFLANRLGIGDVCMFAGARPHDEIPYWLSAADCLVLSSSSEGLGAILIEAMMCRVPVVATAVGGIPELISPGHTGTLVPPKDHIALSKAIEDVLNGDAHVQAMVQHAEMKARSSLTWEANARKTLALYQYQLYCGRKTRNARELNQSLSFGPTPPSPTQRSSEP
jgi:teichuronic acid biosynthesis glycosyltransferase TuaC